MARSAAGIRVGGGLLLLCCWSVLAAQKSPPFFSTIAIGVGFPTPNRSAQFDSRGFAGTLRVGRNLTPHLGAAAELSYQALTIQANHPPVLCPADANCAPPLSGRVNAATLGLALRASGRAGGATMALVVTPAWTWLSAVPVGARAAGLSLAISSSLALGAVGPFRNLLEARYQRSLAGNAFLQSAVQVGLGLSWH